ncbi:MAG TPA: bifunctional nuclease family protein [Fimbriimonadaceae bacterium]|nr:bifunctional nuclease family protein [Fimbriimonadaceae bacterium]
MPEDYEGPEGPDNLNDPPPFFPYEGDDPVREPGSLGELIEVTIEGVFVAESAGNISRFVLLSDGERKLPILIGPYEAQAISLPLENTRPDRPMTHDLLKTIVERLDGTIDRVVIDDLWNTIYYAKLYVKNKKDEELEIDARPSDAVALAVRFDAPVYVADGILDAAVDE